MDSDAAAGGALSEAIVFLYYFRDLNDPRQQGKVQYPLNEVLLLCLLAILAGAETIADIARFGEKKLALLRRFLPFRDGTPAHDHLGDILAVLDAEKFQHCFVSWVSALTGCAWMSSRSMAKPSRRSYQKKGAKDAIHIVSAFAVTPAARPWSDRRWRKNPMRLSPFPSCSTCWSSRAPSSPSTPWVVSATSLRKSWTRRPTTSWR